MLLVTPYLFISYLLLSISHWKIKLVYLEAKNCVGCLNIMYVYVKYMNGFWA